MLVIKTTLLTFNPQNLTEFWSHEKLQSSPELVVSGERVFLENLDLRDSISSTAEKVGDASIFGMMLLCSPRTEEVRARALAALSQRTSFKQRQKRQCGEGN